MSTTASQHEPRRGGEETLRAVLLDWDGTVVDSRAAVLAACRAVTERLLGDAFPRTAEQETLVLTRSELAMFTGLCRERRLAERLVDAYRAEYVAQTRTALAFPGAARLLDTLVGAGIRVGVVTSKARGPYAHDLATLALPEPAVAITGDLAMPSKPDPAPVEACLAALGVPAAQALMAGDAPADVLAGRAAGVRTAVLRHGFDLEGARAAGPDHELDDLAALGRLVATLAAASSPSA
jgi:HAD superfamily hydrolase (TIGR01549 family)